MCGIVGILIKPESKRKNLGKWITPMITCMGDRGSDSAGLAVFSSLRERNLRRYSLCSPQSGFDWKVLGEALRSETSCQVDMSWIENHGRLVSSVPAQTLECRDIQPAHRNRGRWRSHVPDAARKRRSAGRLQFRECRRP